MKVKYGNWMPRYMPPLAAVIGVGLAAGGLRAGGAVTRTVCYAGSAAAFATAAYYEIARQAFSYTGKRKLAKEVTEGIAQFAAMPPGGTGLDVGCGSGALTIACAKRCPDALMIGLDRWGIEYYEYSQEVCEANAIAEDTPNTRFVQGDARELPFDDETFDLVTSNYVYHNISGVSKQKLLRETLRVLKKGGTFLIHDLMSPARYGDMQAFVDELRSEGYERVELIDTADGMFMTRMESRLFMLAGSRLLTGVK